MRHSLILLIGIIAAVLVFSVWLIVPRPPVDPVTVTILGRTNDASGLPLMAIQLHNVSSAPFNFYFETEIATESGWQTARLQPPNARMAHHLAPESSRTLLVPTATNGPDWRVSFSYQRAGSRISSRLDTWATKLRIRHSYFDSKRILSPAIKNDGA